MIKIKKKIKRKKDQSTNIKNKVQSVFFLWEEREKKKEIH